MRNKIKCLVVIAIPVILFFMFGIVSNCINYIKVLDDYNSYTKITVDKIIVLHGDVYITTNNDGNLLKITNYSEASIVTGTPYNVIHHIDNTAEIYPSELALFKETVYREKQQVLFNSIAGLFMLSAYLVGSIYFLKKK